MRLTSLNTALNTANAAPAIMTATKLANAEPSTKLIDLPFKGQFHGG